MTALAALPVVSRLRDAIVASIRANIPKLKSVEAHGGVFDLEELKRHVIVAPCVRVCITGTGAVERRSSGEFVLPVSLALVVITRDSAEIGKGRSTRDEAALAIVSALQLHIAGNRWNVSGVWPPQNTQGTNEFSGAIDKTGAALWQITFDQSILLGEEDEIAAVIAALSEVWINGALEIDIDGGAP